MSSSGVGCFPAAGVCVSPGTFTLTSVVSSIFNPSGQDIVANVDYAGRLTDLTQAPIGPVLLSGTLEEVVEGRTFATEIGSWPTDLVALSLTGSVQGQTLALTLDPAHDSSGVTSIDPIGGGEREAYLISSFFDVFVELSLDGLNATRGPIRATVAPEPATLTMLALPLAALTVMRRRRKTGSR